MTLMLFLLLLQQPPALEAATSADVEPGPCLQLTVSRTGKILVIGRPDLLEIRTAADLMPLRFLKGPWTGFSFDEKDEHLVLVDGDLIRIDTKEWNEKSREPLDGIDLLRPKPNFLKPGAPTVLSRQAYVADDGAVYYRSKGGHVSRAVRKDGKLVCERLSSEVPAEEYRVEGIIGAIASTPFLTIHLGRAAIVSQEGRPCYLIASYHTFLGAPVGDAVAFVGGSYEGLYDPRTWKVRFIRQAEDSENITRHAAVADPKSGWVLVAEEKGLRAWNTKEFKQESRYKEFAEPCLNLALDGANRVLYTLEAEKLRRWKLKD